MRRPPHAPAGLYDARSGTTRGRASCACSGATTAAHVPLPARARVSRLPAARAAPGTALSGRGRLLSWTVFHRQYFPAAAVPYIVVAVETEEGPILVGNC